MSRSRRSTAAVDDRSQADAAHRVEPAARRWPADDPQELADQLRLQLERLEAPDHRGEAQDEAVRLATAYLKHAQTLAWRAVGRGDFDSPRKLLDALLTAHGFFDDHFPEMPPPARAAVEIHATFQSFYVAAEALEELRTEARLTDPRRSRTDRAVLRVLAANQDRYLRRGEIHEQLDRERKPTVARVGQILAKLYDEGLLLSVQGPAQGNPDTAFYALSGLGREVCDQLPPTPPVIVKLPQAIKAAEKAEAPELLADLAPDESPQFVQELDREDAFRKLVAAAEGRSSDARRVAIGALTSGCLRLFSQIPTKALLARLQASPGSAEPAYDLCRQVGLHALLAKVGEGKPSRHEVTFGLDPERWRVFRRDVTTLERGGIHP